MDPPHAPHAPVLSRYDLAARLMMDPAATDDVLRLPPEAVDAAVRATQRGAYLLKFGRSGRPQKRFVRVTDEGDALYWVSRRKKRADSTLQLATVERLQRGQHTSVFARHARDFGHLSPLCLSIVAAGGFRSLDLAFESPAQLETWTVALTALLLRQRAASDDGDTKQLWRAFVAEDVDGSSTITYHQCKALLRRLNIYQHKKRLKVLYRHVLLTAPPPTAAPGGASSAGCAPGGAAADDEGPAAGLLGGAPVEARGDSVAAGGGGGARVPPPPPLPTSPVAPDAALLTFQAVMRLVDLLRDRPDVSAVYHALIAREQAAPLAPPVPAVPQWGAAATAGAAAPPPPPPVAMMPLAVFQSFLQHDQKEAATSLEAARRLALHYDPAHGATHISLAAFTAFLTSAGNSAYAPEATRVDYHDMGHPLSAYFIESSHNTYLEGDQLQSPASVSAYISVVQKGARCVELDCWDGPAGEPVIYHGHTLTGRIPFADVCRALRDFGFVASPYPLILSLEMHCGPKQQERIASILLDTFGSALAAPLSEPAAGGGGGGGSVRTRSLSVASSVSSVGSASSDAIRPSTSQSGFSAGGASGSARRLLPDDGGASLASWPSNNTSAGEPLGGDPDGPSSVAGGSGGESALQQQRAPLVCMDVDALPSPAALLRKVVVKAKVARRRQPPLPPPPPQPPQPLPLLPLLGGGQLPPLSVAVGVPDALSGSASTEAASPRCDAHVVASTAAAATPPPPPSFVLGTPTRWQTVTMPDPSALSPGSSALLTSPVAAAAALRPGGGTPTAAAAAVGAVLDASGVASSPLPVPSRSRASSVTVAGGGGSGGGGVGSSILRRFSRKLSIGTAGDSVAALSSSSSAGGGVTSEQPPSPAGSTAAARVTDSQPTAAASALPTLAEQAPAKPLLVPTLRSLVLLAAVPFESLEHCAAAGERAWVMHSLKEPKAARLLARAGGAGALLLHTSRQLLRVYPGPLRVDSSNFHGGPFWAAGVQMVALNHQTHDVPMRVARAFFRLNGRCGFVLKPAYMRDADAIAALGAPPGPTGGGGGAGAGSGAAAGESAPAAEPASVAVHAGGSRSGHLADPPPFQHHHPSSQPPARAHGDLRVVAPRAATLALRMYEASPRMVLAGGGTADAFDVVRSGPAVEVAEAAPLNASPPRVTASLARGSSGDGGSGDGSGVEEVQAARSPPQKQLAARPTEMALDTLSPALDALPPPPPPPPPLPRAFSLGALKRTLSGAWLQQLQHHPGAGRSPLLLQPRDDAAEPDAFTLLVTVMGAQHLPKRGGASESAGVPSPFCTVGVHGDPADRVKFASHVVSGNGFNPVWSAQFRFVLARPEVAVLYIGVHDQLDVARKAFLAYFAVPVAALRPGYRSCQLRSALGKKIPFCSLLCRFQRRPL